MVSTRESSPARGRPPGKGMRWIPTGEFRMGSEDFYPEEAPVTQVALDGFWIDERPVTVAEFRRFVRATGHVTVAERPLDAEQYPDGDPDLLLPGALVFHQTPGPVDLDDYSNWWTYVPGANWRNPEGPGSTLDGRDRHPVTQVAFEDAEAYARWAGKDVAHRGGMGVRSPGGFGRCGVRLGRRVHAQGKGDGQHVAWRVPMAAAARSSL